MSAPVTDQADPPPEVSVVMPCLNEADTVAVCVQKALRALKEYDITGEVIVADNGSTDGSAELAAASGARVVSVTERGYGHALMGGIAAARGRYVVMGDADDSYDFGEVPRFVERLREGFDLVQGCRLPSGGGRILPGAMPLSHRWLGNPLLSFLARKMFWSPVTDVYCGLRGFRKAFYESLDQHCTGMEFATEMIIKAGFAGGKIAEVPVTLHPDGRKAHPPHLHTLRDGWRTLRFFLLYCPRWLFWYPGVGLIAFGLLGYALALPGVRLGGVRFEGHSLLVATLALFLGYQSLLFAVFTKTFAAGEGLLPEDSRLTRLYRVVTLERGLLAGGAAFLMGLVLLLVAVNEWRRAEFGDLDYAHTLRWVIPGVALCTLGFQTVLSSFFLSILQMKRR